MQITFLGALQLLFIALKLTGVINWSWWWVLAPLLVQCSAHFLLWILKEIETPEQRAARLLRELRKQHRL